MIKQKVLTFIGIIMALAIAAGGWVLVDSLIDSRSEALVSATGTVLAAQPQAAFSAEVVDDTYDNQVGEYEEEALPYVSQQGLSEREIVAILRNWDAGGNERPHEPTSEQISMEEAIDIGREALFRLGGHLFPEGSTISHARAFLSQNIEPGRGTFLDPMFSYWTVSFMSLDEDLHEFHVSLRINAVTGQVWRIYLERHGALLVGQETFTVEQIDRLLSDFTSDLGLSGLDQSVVSIETTERGIAAYRSFADGEARVLFSASGRPTREGEWMFFQYSIILTAQRSTVTLF